ncbi:MAG: cation transporter [Gammaproteobacteria bacterium]|nr:cation transporter [Gammaproteobacteria bacterium]
MRKLFLILALCLSAFGGALVDSAAALAGELKTITLSVDKMTCNMCPITVKKALRAVDGVTEVSAKYEGDGIGWATVTYDPAKADVEDLTFATEQAGYPSRLTP